MSLFYYFKLNMQYSKHTNGEKNKLLEKEKFKTPPSILGVKYISHYEHVQLGGKHCILEL